MKKAAPDPLVYQAILKFCAIFLSPLVSLQILNRTLLTNVSKDYTAMSGMILGEIPSLESVLANIERFEQIVNSSAGA